MSSRSVGVMVSPRMSTRSSISRNSLSSVSRKPSISSAQLGDNDDAAKQDVFSSLEHIAQVQTKRRGRLSMNCSSNQRKGRSTSLPSISSARRSSSGSFMCRRGPILTLITMAPLRETADSRSSSGSSACSVNSSHNEKEGSVPFTVSSSTNEENDIDTMIQSLSIRFSNKISDRKPRRHTFNTPRSPSPHQSLLPLQTNPVQKKEIWIASDTKQPTPAKKTDKDTNDNLSGVDRLLEKRRESVLLSKNSGNYMSTFDMSELREEISETAYDSAPSPDVIKERKSKFSKFLKRTSFSRSSSLSSLKSSSSINASPASSKKKHSEDNDKTTKRSSRMSFRKKKDSMTESDNDYNENSGDEDDYLLITDRNVSVW
eukprot:CAMPEP_0195538830 /NCGR_PEP_ID=MMETSP0794_2-20130614/49739_1 /TAXON_ID=515487 /ORGANISM="Stephanopyxis turris, Strain CCMP 815" /LENGTH=372 /DNA_ID=CAMNT_0040672841 /DNA_START=183 /DNA_END=1298 /DNA_ORIENTATION=+